MHDWTLLSILYEWKAARVTLSLRTEGPEQLLIVADGVSHLHIPQTKPWGPSVSVNKLHELPASSDKGRKLEIEMQSGDVIQIEAEIFNFPTGVNP
jgi:hypothetical protein